MSAIKVVGITSAQEVFVGSSERNFRINEYLVVKDRAQGDLLGEIIEAHTFNRYIPLSIAGDFADSKVMESMRALGYDIDEETIYVGKLRLLNEAKYPVETGSDIKLPRFSEIKNLLLTTSIDKGLVLGVIKNTDSLAKEMDEELKGVVKTFGEEGLQEQTEVPYIFDHVNMHQYPHIGVFGGSGSGKSFGLRVLLEEIMKKNIPTIVMDPHYEMDFSEKAPYFEDMPEAYDGKFACLQIGVHIGIKFDDLSSSDLKNLLDASHKLTEPMANVVDVLFRGKNSLSGFSDKLKMLSEAQELGGESGIRRRIAESESEDERRQWERRLKMYEDYNNLCPAASVRGVIWRLNRLNNEGIFSRDISPIIDALNAGELVVIQGSTRILQVFSSYLLNTIYRKRRDYKDSIYKNKPAEYFPPFILVTDEAHNFAPKGIESPAKAVIKEISQEGRKYGAFLVLASQRPNLLDETITAQLNTKFIFRTVRASDIDTIRAETDLSPEETKRLPYLRTGDLFISSAALGRTSFVRIRAADTSTPHKENPFEEWDRHKSKDEDAFIEIIEEFLPINEGDFLEIIQQLERKHSKRINVEQLGLKLEKLVDAGYLTVDNIFGKRFTKRG